MKGNHLALVASAISFSILIFSQHAFAAEIVLKSGRKIEAKVLKISEKSVKLDLDGVEMAYPPEQIRSINGMEDFSMAQLREFRDLGYQYVEEAVATHPINAEKCDEGISMIKKIEELDLPDMPAIDDMIEVTKRCKKHDDSIPYIEKRMKTRKGDAKAHMELANVYRHHGHDKAFMDKAIAEYEKAVAIEGPTAENQYAIGMTYSVFDEEAKAIPYFKKAIELKPNDWDAYSVMGSCYLEIDKYEEALAALQKAVELGSPKGRTYHALGKTYEALGQNEKAAEAERKAKELGYFL